MRKEFDFTGAKRAQDVPELAKLQAETGVGKVRITMYVDADVLAAFRKKAEAEGKGYQTLINEALREAATPENAPVTIETLRKVLREELHAA
ncbi:MAG: BrnA antitoxin family protein [Sulfuricellaceae bacterium]|nr:BrnA antitoxin family protein [Sulfuricellaceae bacterium]